MNAKPATAEEYVAIEERPRRGLTERIVQATAQRYIVSAEAFDAQTPSVAQTDQLSSRYLIALGARIVREVADLARSADQAGKPLASLAIDTEICFASAADRAAFAAELADAVNQLVARNHDERASGGRWNRLIVAAHPRPPLSRTTHRRSDKETQSD